MESSIKATIPSSTESSYQLFPIGEENVILERWNYVLDRSVNVTTIVVQNDGKLFGVVLLCRLMPFRCTDCVHIFKTVRTSK